MKKIVILFILVLLLHQTIFTLEVRKDSYGRDLYASDRIKIKLNNEASRRINTLLENNERTDQTGLVTFDALNNEYGVTKIILAHRPVNDKAWEQQTGFDRWYIVFVSERTDIEHAISQYKNNEYVEFANPEYLAYTSATPNDLYFDDCWGHDNTVSNGPGSGHTVGFDSHIEEAWDDEQGYGVSSVIIAIIDTGTDYNHVDLDNNCVAGYDYGDNDSDPMDDSSDEGHGTCCAGVAAGEVNNSIGVAGVAGGCSIMPLKIANSAGSMTFTAIDNAITHCGDNNVDVASMSFGADISQGQSPSTDAAIVYAYNSNVTMLAATANDDYSHIHYPANHEYVISVGAASPCEERKRASSCDAQNWWGSNYGVNTQDDRASVDIIAPTILPATDVTGSNGYSTGDYITNFNGTSCATPYAAGVAALVISKNPYLTPAQVRTALTSTATDVIDEETTPGWDMYTGYGMVNADAAVGSVAGSGFPLCNITNPTNGEVIESGTIETITVTASDPGGTITNVKIYIDDVWKVTDTSAPYEYVWDTGSESLDYHTIKAIATDNNSNASEDEISVQIAECLVSSFPWTEDFENSGTIPNCWSQEYVVNTQNWGFYNGGYNGHPSSAHGGNYNAYLYNGSYTANVTKLITPPMDLSEASESTLKFWHTQALWPNDQDELRVYYKTSFSGSWNLLATYTDNITSWTEETLSLSGLSSDYYVGFEGTAQYGYGVCVDDVSITAVIPGYGEGDNSGDNTLPVFVDVEQIVIDDQTVDPNTDIDPEGDVTLNVSVQTYADAQQTIDYPDEVGISYEVDITGNFSSSSEICFTLYNLNQLQNYPSGVYWWNGSAWANISSADWSVSYQVSFCIPMVNRNGSTEIVLDKGGESPLPVTLSSFTAAYISDLPIINWVTQSETDNIGWNVYRSNSYNFGQAFMLNLETIPGNGTTSQPSFYSFVDEYEVFESFTYWYWLESISGSGETESYGPVSLTIPSEGNDIPEIPLITELRQNFPNPFNPSTLISFDIKEDETGVLSIYNIKGQLIVTEKFETGRHQYAWDARNQASGVYLYKLKTKYYSKIMKMLLVK